MNNDYVMCPACGACHFDSNLIICPSCGAELHPVGSGAQHGKKYNIITAYISMFRRFSDFRGRSRRSEYWYAYLANLIIVFCMVGALLAIDYFAVANVGPDGEFAKGYVNAFNIVNGIFTLYSLVIFIPQLALITRRLHDVGKSSLYLLLMLVMPIGTFILMAIMALDGVRGANRYGEDPKM